MTKCQLMESSWIFTIFIHGLYHFHCQNTRVTCAKMAFQAAWSKLPFQKNQWESNKILPLHSLESQTLLSNTGSGQLGDVSGNFDTVGGMRVLSKETLKQVLVRICWHRPLKASTLQAPHAVQGVILRRVWDSFFWTRLKGKYKFFENFILKYLNTTITNAKYCIHRNREDHQKASKTGTLEMRTYWCLILPLIKMRACHRQVEGIRLLIKFKFACCNKCQNNSANRIFQFNRNNR